MESDAAEILKFAGITIAVHVPAKTTGGAFSVLEEVPPLLDTPAHVHANEDEYFHILEGEHVITVGEVEHRLGPGEGVFAPRGVPHSQQRLEDGVGRLMLVAAPGGLEGFFRRLAEADAKGALGEDVYASASAEYGITWL